MVYTIHLWLKIGDSLSLNHCFARIKVWKTLGTPCLRYVRLGTPGIVGQVVKGHQLQGRLLSPRDAIIPQHQRTTGWLVHSLNNTCKFDKATNKSTRWWSSLYIYMTIPLISGKIVASLVLSLQHYPECRFYVCWRLFFQISKREKYSETLRIQNGDLTRNTWLWRLFLLIGELLMSIRGWVKTLYPWWTPK